MVKLQKFFIERIIMLSVIFIGAGPVGLFAAIQLKLQCPAKSILMFEQYETPTRTHAMYVDSNSFAGMDRSHGFGDILDKIPAKVIISDLEKTLRAFAASIGITIKYEVVKNVEALQELYPETRFFVGSGGLRGVVHPEIFSSENQIKEDLRYAVEVKYKAVGEVRSLSKLTQIPGILAHTNHVVSEYVGHLKDGLTPVSLRIFIDDETYGAMKAATFKKPYTLNDTDKIPANLYQTIVSYMKGRKHLAGEKIEEGTLKISTITLSLYASKDFGKRVGEKVFLKVGEEGFACPFYRSFNDNVSCVPSFVRTMDALFHAQLIERPSKVSSTFFSSSSEDQDPLVYFQNSMQSMVDSEIRTVRLINTGVDILETSALTSRAIPQVAHSKLKVQGNGRMFLADVAGQDVKMVQKDATSSSCLLL